MSQWRRTGRLRQVRPCASRRHRDRFRSSAVATVDRARRVTCPTRRDVGDGPGFDPGGLERLVAPTKKRPHGQDRRPALVDLADVLSHGAIWITDIRTLVDQPSGFSTDAMAGVGGKKEVPTPIAVARTAPCTRARAAIVDPPTTPAAVSSPRPFPKSRELFPRRGSKDRSVHRDVGSPRGIVGGPVPRQYGVVGCA